MPSHAIFQLNISHAGTSDAGNSQYLFQLTWSVGDRSQSRSARLEYPNHLRRSYQCWQHSYKDVNFSTPKAESNVDPKHILQIEETDLIQSLNDWLNSQADVINLWEAMKDVARQGGTERSSHQADNAWIDLLIACDSPEVAKLPWEQFAIAANGLPIRITRTVMNPKDMVNPVHQTFRRGGNRILAIASDAPDLYSSEAGKNARREEDRAIQSLRRIGADIQVFKPTENGKNIRDQFIDILTDDRGWDALIFIGHSAETALTGGQFTLAPGIELSMTAIEQAVCKLIDQGLQVAIFYSCCGMQIAETLVKQGLPNVLVMREPMHYLTTAIFLKALCTSLRQHNDLREAVRDACVLLEKQKLAYPSAYLVPSLFCHPQAPPFRFEPSWLKRFQQHWGLSHRETMTLGSILLLSFVVPLQHELLNLRTTVQAIYRTVTGQLSTANPVQDPPVLLVAIDQDSINTAKLQPRFTGLDPRMMDREYLADIVKQLSADQIPVIGIDYLLDIEAQPSETAQLIKQEKLANAIKEAVATQQTWFVLSASEQDKLRPIPKIAPPQWTLQGNTDFYTWQLELPQNNATCDRPCPFAYLLALTALLNKPGTSLPAPAPTTHNPPTDLSLTLHHYLRQPNRSSNLVALQQLTQAPFGMQSIIDFSLPPNQVYQHITAAKLLGLPLSDRNARSSLPYPVAIIAAGGYADAGIGDEKDRFTPPLAIQYWCFTQNWEKQPQPPCRLQFTGGEAHAYMVHHLFNRHRILLIPDYWLIGLALITGKWVSLMLRQQRQKQRQKQIWSLVLGSIVYMILGLQGYISVLVLMPIFLPLLVFWLCVLPVVRRKSYA